MPKMGFRSVLVTGADGFVGRHLVAALRKRDNIPLTLCGGPSAKAVSGCQPLDLADEAAIESVIAETRPDLVLHLAAQASVDQGNAATAATWDVNFGGSFRIAQAIERYTPNSTLFFVSSAEVYGAAFNDGVVNEDTCLRPQSVYARSKAAAEAMLADVLPSSARLIVARPSNHSGAGQDVRFVLPSFARQIAEAEHALRLPEIKVGNLVAERDFMHVDSVIDTYLQLLTKAHNLPNRLTVNIASGKAIRVRSLLDIMLSKTDLPIVVKTDIERLRQSDISSTQLDTKRLNELGIKSPAPADEHLLQDVLNDQRAKLR